MMKETKHQPPMWAERFLRWYCRPELVEDLQGDLNEYFHRHCKTKGPRMAKLIYVIDVFKFLRPYTLIKPKLINLLIHWIMIGSYLKTSGRNLVRNKLFSFINIVGLAVSMSVGLLLIALLSDMKQYDRFHEHHDQTYRVISSYKYLDQENDDYFASTSLRAGQLIQESIPGIEQTAILYRGFSGDMTFGEKTTPLDGLWANESVLKVFTFPMVSGDPSTALKDPYSVVLTEKSAKKLFGGEDALGKTIIRHNDKADRQFVVTGVIRDIPVFSHIQFDMLASLSTREITEKDNKYEMAWDNMWEAYVYVLLPPETDLQNLRHNLAAISKKENKTTKNTTINLALQPLSEIALGEELNNSIGPVMGTSSVWMISVLSAIVILSACFNYTNLSIARSLRRSREVGIRKVVGAQKSQVLVQFIVEAVMISLAALLLAFVLFILLRPYLLSVNPQYRRMLLLEVSPKLIVYFVGLAITVGVAAGVFPALFFARINAIRVLKNISALGGFRKVIIRKGLIVAQFTVSLMFIAATITGYKHYKAVVAFDLGFDTENILNISLFGNKPQLLTQVLSEVPEVKALSTSSMVASVGNYSVNNMKYNNPQDSSSVYYIIIDEHYLTLHGHRLLAGRNFNPLPDSAMESEVIVNEKVLKRFNIANRDPQRAIGEVITVNGKKLQIVGVVKDYYYGKSIDQEIKEFIFRYGSNKANYVNAKVISADWPATLTKVDKAWKKIDPVHPLEATFYNDEIAKSYSDFYSRINVIGSLAFLAICIASIGLFGMVVFTTQTRLKEISVRKVMGASEVNLVYLLSKGFLFLLGISSLIALPATRFFFNRYVLDEYADVAPAAWNEWIIGVLAVMAIAFVMIGTQTLKVARSNPAKVLKNE